MFKKCFCFFEQEGVFYDFKAIKIMKHTKKIFDLSYWTGLYDQNCRIYTTFYRFGHTGPMVIRYTGRLSQLLAVEMNWGKKSKKKPSVLNNFCFLINFIWHTGAMVTMVPMVTRHTGGLSELPVVEMSWGKKSKKKHSILTNFCFLVNFTRHTGPMVTMVTTGDQVHRRSISASSGQNELGKKI